MFNGSDLIGKVCWVRFAGSGLLGQVAGLLGQICLVSESGLLGGSGLLG